MKRSIGGFGGLMAVFLAAVVFGSGCSRQGSVDSALKRADEYVQKGELDKARLEYLRLLRDNPGNAPAIRGLGLVWFESGAPLQAAPLLLHTLKGTPKDTVVALKMANIYLSFGDVVSARKEVLSVLDREPNQPDALLLLAESTIEIKALAETNKRLDLAVESGAARETARAILSQRGGKLAEASAHVEEALKADPKFAAAWVAKGNLATLANQPKVAEEAFAKAAEFSPLRSVTRLKQPQFLVASRNLGEARKILEPLMQKAPDFIPALLMLARLDLDEKKFDDASATLAKVVSRDSSNYEARTLEAKLAMLQGDAKKAVALLKQLTAGYPQFPAGFFELARAYLLDGSPTQAISALNEVLKLNPRFTEAQLLLGELNLRNGDPQSVIRSMTEVLKTNPNLFQAQMLLAQSYQAVGQYAEAEKILTAQLAASPDKVDPMLLLGIVLRQLGRPDEAREKFEKALTLAPGNLLALSQILDMDVAAGKTVEALKRVQAAITKTSDAAGLHFLEARIFLFGKDDQKAEGALNRAIELDPDFTAAYGLLIDSYFRRGEMASARDRTEQFLTRHPENTQTRIVAGMIYERLKDNSKAIASYEKVLATDPDSVTALNNLAVISAEQLKNLDRAKELATKARTLRPDDAYISDTLGWILYQRGDYEGAFRTLSESAAKAPEEPEIQYHLGKAAYIMGRMDAARTAFQNATNSPKDFGTKADAKIQLESITQGAGVTKSLPLPELEKLASSQPRDPITQTKLGQAYLEADRPKDAAAAFERALAINVNLPEAAVALAGLYAGPLNQKEKATRLLQRVKEADPDNAKVATLLAGIAMKVGNFAWAYSLLRDVVSHDSKDAAVLAALGTAAYRTNKTDEARDLYKQALDLGPAEPIASEARDFLELTAISNPKEAVAVTGSIRRVLQKDPDNIPALMADGLLQQGAGKFADAIKDYERVLAQSGDFAMAQRQLATLLAQDPAQAKRAFELATKARTLFPDDRDLTLVLAKLNFERGDNRAARQLLDNAARQQPLDAEGMYYLGLACWKLDDKKESAAALHQAVEKGLSKPLEDEARRVIAILEPKP